jgi:hypothetical protein
MGSCMSIMIVWERVLGVLDEFWDGILMADQQEKRKQKT